MVYLSTGRLHIPVQVSGGIGQEKERANIKKRVTNGLS
jgi:hypothetical protein